MKLYTPQYTVQARDTLSAIALHFYGRASLYPELARANAIKNPDHIEVGQRIALPEFVG